MLRSVGPIATWAAESAWTTAVVTSSLTRRTRLSIRSAHCHRPGQRLGLIQVADKEGTDDRVAEFTEMDASVLYQLAQLAAVAVENAERFDLLLQDLAEGEIATAVYMVIDPSTGRLDVVTSGHPAPAVLEPQGRARYVVRDPHAPLGVLPQPSYGVTTEPLLSGSLVLLYTDGLVERRDTGLDDRLRELLTVVQIGGDDLAVLCDHILDDVLPEASDDDVALLAVRLVR